MKKRATVQEKPALLERAGDAEKPKLKKRAATSESPGTEKRADDPESPEAGERAATTESPARSERAEAKESPDVVERSIPEIRARLHVLVRDHASYKRWETRYRNALKLKGNDEEQKRPTPYEMTPEYKGRMESLLIQSDAWTDGMEKEIRKMVHQLPIWKEWAVNVKPLGELTIAYLEAYVDFRKSTSTWARDPRPPIDRPPDLTGEVVISNVWRFCGYGPASDKGAPGKRKYCAPIKTQLYQWGLSLEKLGAACESKYYAILIGIKERYANSENEVEEKVKNKGSHMVPWKDARPGHRRNAAIRRAVKELIKDYVLARAGLEDRIVRPPYGEKFLGEKHSE